MKKKSDILKLFFCAILFLVLLTVALLLVLSRKHEKQPPTQINIAQGNIVSGKSVHISSGKTASLNKIAKTMESKSLQTTPEDDPWRKIPNELDKLMKNEFIDTAIQNKVSDTILSFLTKNQLDDSRLVSVACTVDICRIALAHDSKIAFSKYTHNLTFLSLMERSNYYNGNPNEDGTVDSVLWIGQEDYILPLEELYQQVSISQ